ncbi:MAG: aspartate/glutamate racemase family protein [Planctomycetales bacterium]|nr:aspartate/glutamate racemase family protein [Planctomycetales bacterium]
MILRKKLGLIHTSATLVAPFQELCQELLPDVHVFNIADDSLIKEVIATGELAPNVSWRLANHVQSAEAAGADLIMVTCSSVGPAVEASQAFVDVPVVRVDQAMAEQAIQTGKRIGVVATLPTTLAPTVDLIERRAASAQHSISLASELCEGAFESLMNGDAATHDRLVRQKLEQLIESSDVIVLAQASMARVVDQIPEPLRQVPILSSPRLAVSSLVPLFGQME